jgi:hypothetical protein
VGAYRRQIILATVVGALLLGLYLLSSPVGGDDETTTTAIPGGADPADVAVIDDWAQTLSDGDVKGAAALFALPSVAENGATLRIGDLEEAVLFNSSLPCGATLVEAEPAGALTVATFELVERPGPGTCGAGTGAEARTAFRIEDGKITEWRRVAGDDGGGGAPAAPSTSA